MTIGVFKRQAERWRRAAPARVRAQVQTEARAGRGAQQLRLQALQAGTALAYERERASSGGARLTAVGG